MEADIRSSSSRGLPARTGGAPAVVTVMTACIVAAGSPARGQDKIPRIPSGVPLVVAPVQAVLPTAGGGWPGGASTREGALEAANAEVDFAVSEEPRARKWAPPAAVVRQAGRNPMLDVDPRQLSSRALTVDDGGRYLYEPLHGQLRSLAALLDARLVALPLVVWYRPPEEIADADEASGEDDAPSGAAPPAGGTGDGAGRTPRARPAGSGGHEDHGRAMMQLAIIDARAGKVLWKGEIGGARAPADSPAALATLAAQLVKVLSNS